MGGIAVVVVVTAVPHAPFALSDLPLMESRSGAPEAMPAPIADTPEFDSRLNPRTRRLRSMQLSFENANQF